MSEDEQTWEMRGRAALGQLTACHHDGWCDHRYTARDILSGAYDAELQLRLDQLVQWEQQARRWFDAVCDVDDADGISFGMQRYLRSLELCGEAGELANLLKKDWTGQPGDRAAAEAEEVADIAIVLCFVASALGVEIGPAVLAKLDVLRQRHPRVVAALVDE